MTSPVSTVPGAIGTLQTHLENVSAANPSLDVGVYLGVPFGEEVTENVLVIGGWPDGELITGYEGGFAAIPGQAMLLKEDYSILCHIRTWAGNANQLQRITDAFNLLDGIIGELVNDIGGSGSLSPSGSWVIQRATNPYCGPMGGGGGWGFVLQFAVHVFNVQITGTPNAGGSGQYADQYQGSY